MTQRPAKGEIEFDLLSNAVDSLHHAIDNVAPLGEEAVAKDYKQAILAVAHAVELLLKERLQREHPALIWRNVETRRYWYVDHLHYGQASHLDVFDARGCTLASRIWKESSMLRSSTVKRRLICKTKVIPN